jgi:protein involved in ribonucleotide reduction
VVILLIPLKWILRLLFYPISTFNNVSPEHFVEHLECRKKVIEKEHRRTKISADIPFFLFYPTSSAPLQKNHVFYIKNIFFLNVF